MTKFGDEEVLVTNSDEEDADDDESYRGFRFPEPVPRHQIATVHLDEQGVHGHTLSGEVLFEIQQSRLQADLFTAGKLLELISAESLDARPEFFFVMAASYRCPTLSAWRRCSNTQADD